MKLAWLPAPTLHNVERGVLVVLVVWMIAYAGRHTVLRPPSLTGAWVGAAGMDSVFLVLNDAAGAITGAGVARDAHRHRREVVSVSGFREDRHGFLRFDGDSNWVWAASIQIHNRSQLDGKLVRHSDDRTVSIEFTRTKDQ